MAFDIISPVTLGRGSVTAVVSTFYTVPILTRTIVKTIDICNTNLKASSVTVYLVPSGGSAGDSTTLIPDVTLTGNGMFQWAGAQVLEVGDTIQAISSESGITINISGGEGT